MIRGRLNVFILILIFLISTISSAAVISANINQSQTNNVTNESRLTNDANQTENNTNSTDNQTINQTMDNQTKDALEHNLTQKLDDLDSMCNGSNSSVMAEYFGQKLQELKSEVNSSNISSATKKKLILNINTALNVNNQSANSLVNGNYDQAQDELAYESGLIDQINVQIANGNGTTINPAVANNLTQTINEIKTGQNNGPDWILQNDTDLQFSLTTQYYTDMADKVNDIRGIISELKAGGVNVTIEKGSTSNTSNIIQRTMAMATGSTDDGYNIKIDGNIIYKLTSHELAVLDGVGIIDTIQQRTGGTICQQCQAKIIATCIISTLLIDAATAGIGTEADMALTLADIAIGVVDSQVGILEQQYTNLYNQLWNVFGDGCVCEPYCDCIFYYTKLINLVCDMRDPGNVHANDPTPVSVTVTNTKHHNATAFNVAFYEANMEGQIGNDIQYTLIGTQRVNGLAGKNSASLTFNWTPSKPGNYTLKAVADSGNEVSEVNEGDNDAQDMLTVGDRIERLTLYNVEYGPKNQDCGGYKYVIYYFKSAVPFNTNIGRVVTLTTSSPVKTHRGGFTPWGYIYPQISEDGQNWIGSSTLPTTFSENQTTYNQMVCVSLEHAQYFKFLVQDPSWMNDPYDGDVHTAVTGCILNPPSS